MAVTIDGGIVTKTGAAALTGTARCSYPSTFELGASLMLGEYATNRSCAPPKDPPMVLAKAFDP